MIRTEIDQFRDSKFNGLKRKREKARIDDKFNITYGTISTNWEKLINFCYDYCTGHHITIEVLKIAKHPRKDYTFNEVLAEMTAYFLMKSFDENIEYNFAYSNVWSSRIEDNFEVDEFMTLTTKILEVSSIKTIKNHFFLKKFTKVNSQKAKQY